MIFSFRGRRMLCDRTRLAGILNVTPDSFSDGGRFLSAPDALRQASRMLDEGAEIIDIGGESSRPGASPVSSDEELSRIIPVVCNLRKARPEAVISVDTVKPAVAAASLEAGADIINNIDGLQNSHEIAEICARFKAGIVLMHMRGTPETMSNLCEYRDLLAEIIRGLRASIDSALRYGVSLESIIVDPGVGFAKKAGQNLEIISNASKFLELGRPLMVGHSRKTFLGEITGSRRPNERVPATCAASFFLALQGTHFLRVHDITENLQAVKIAEAVKKRAD